MKKMTFEIFDTSSLILSVKHISSYVNTTTDALAVPIYLHPFRLGIVGYEQFTLDCDNMILDIYDFSHINLVIINHYTYEIYYDNRSIGKVNFTDTSNSVIIDVLYNDAVTGTIDIVLGNVYDENRIMSLMAFETLYSKRDLKLINKEFKHVDRYIDKKHVYLTE